MFWMRDQALQLVQSGEAGAIDREGGSTFGGVEQARVWWAPGERNMVRQWQEGVIYSMVTIYLTIGLENGPGIWPHSLPVVLSSAPYNSASSASCKIMIHQAYYSLLMARQNMASQKYAAGRIGLCHIDKNLNTCIAMIQNAADLTPVE